jgi:superfamily II DNA or RNA helicase
MATASELDGDIAFPSAIVGDAPPFVLRSYQAEMVEESLRSNIIVVMDTGSGKTHMFVGSSHL